MEEMTKKKVDGNFGKWNFFDRKF